MANDYFQFKQFTIHQDQCAMKVGTDGVLLGAWVSISKAKNILDIGTGTGLICLMLAQRNTDSHITGIEIDKAASQQAQNNVSKSPFSKQVQIKNISLQEFTIDTKFDLIISNPPFFVSDGLLGQNETRNKARHGITMTYEELINHSVRWLDSQGTLALILPASEFPKLKTLISNSNLHIRRECKVYPTPNKGCKRVLLELSFTEQEIIRESLVLEESRHNYSDEMKKLWKDFYLKL